MTVTEINVRICGKTGHTRPGKLRASVHGGSLEIVGGTLMRGEVWTPASEEDARKLLAHFTESVALYDVPQQGEYQRTPNRNTIQRRKRVG